MAAGTHAPHASGKPAPPAASPDAGDNPGYAENQPRDPGEARKPGPRKPPNPDEGGLGRTPESDADPATRE